MSVKLEKPQLEHIKAYRYKTNGLTPLEIYLFDPFWTFIANHLLPDWLAPNALTLGGLIVPLIQFAVIGILSPGFDAFLPSWVALLGWLSLFWYQTIDAIDGK